MAAAKPKRVFVSLDRLAPRHPLYPDVARLDATIRRLERRPRTGFGRGAAPGSRGLPALILPTPPGARAANDSLARLRTRGSAQRSALGARLEALDAAETRRRRQSLAAVQRASQIEGRARRAANADAAYRRQLEIALSGGYVRDYANRRIEIAALESAVVASIVPTQRTYFEDRLAQARTALTALEAAEQQAQREARRTQNDVLEAGTESDNSVLEATLRGERRLAARRTSARLAAEARAFDEDLAAVRGQLAALGRSGGSKGAPPLAPLRAGRVVAEPPATASAVAEPETLRRVRTQRDRLRGALLADLRAWVRAAARARNLAVTFDRAAPAGGRTAPEDRTSDFSRWLDAEGRVDAAGAAAS